MSTFHCGYRSVIISSCLNIVNLCTTRRPAISKNKLKFSCTTDRTTAKPLSCTKIISTVVPVEEKVKLSYFFISNYYLQCLHGPKCSIHDQIINSLKSVINLSRGKDFSSYLQYAICCGCQKNVLLSMEYLNSTAKLSLSTALHDNFRTAMVSE